MVMSDEFICPFMSASVEIARLSIFISCNCSESPGHHETSQR
jgi:hypothetical protein